MTAPLADACEHYAKLIQPLLANHRPEFEPVAEDETCIQVERGIVLPMAMAGAPVEQIDRVMEPVLGADSKTPRVVDAAGHSRPPYPGLLVYACRRAREIARPGDACPALDAWCRRLNSAPDSARGTSAPETLVERAWALRACRAAEDVWPSFEASVPLQPSGALLPPDPRTNPETAWYHELALLHAIASSAPLPAARNAEYHLNETQPDHATNEPWGLLAFVLNPNTHTLADQLLHNVRVLHPHGAQGVTAILLADVLDCLRELARRSG